MPRQIEFAGIRLLVLDVDGVLTDGTVLLHADGSESKSFSLLDGHGVKMWRRAGLEVALLSGRPSPATRCRAAQLQIEHVLEGHTQKLPALKGLLGQLGLRPQQAAYVGDDLLDLPPLRYVGFGVAVANAVDELKQYADYVTTRAGGHGAVREVIEVILKQGGFWESVMERYQAEPEPGSS
ncbi:MAG: HAD hydrolase family protein [Phycisphaerae bacterium]|nr:HAD hydrolase family protein [Phycisphaerae bacterium]